MSKLANLPFPHLWFLLFVLGAVVPLAAFLPWLVTEGPDAGAFLRLAFANRIAAFFTLDVIISALVVLAAAWLLLPVRTALLVTVFCLTVGVSAALPLMLWFVSRTAGETAS